ncbi:MAG: SUMF1/EgtB/PvdO family nonheme iron enzyme [Lentisphaeria bacterium]|nr:SUMF1/EgtB/PvdO family nonheme iron enzyme [Lentisphaeria bacterium]
MKTCCPHCQKMMETSADTNGMEVECPVCKQKFTVSPALKVLGNNTKKTVFLVVLAIFLVAGIAGVFYIANQKPSVVQLPIPTTQTGQTSGQTGQTTLPETESRFPNAATETLTLPGGVELKLIRIPKGRFQMGSPTGESGRDSDERQHWVTLSHDFYLGETEITQGQWKAIMKTDVRAQKAKGSDYGSVTGVVDNHPMYFVSWNDAMQFCEELNKRFSQQLNGKWKFTLPTEAQWEYACRGGTTTALNNGTNLTSTEGRCSNLDKVGWYDMNSGKETHAVRRLAANKFGLYDMHGNVWEWCLDSSNWKSGVVTDTYSGEQKDPVCSTGSYRVMRGGSWSYDAHRCRSASRDSNGPTRRLNFVGFRVALVPVD